MARLQTVVVLPEFLRRAKAIMTDDERIGVVDFIAGNPEAGIPLGGGLRKVRIAREGGGKVVDTERSTCLADWTCQSSS